MADSRLQDDRVYRFYLASKLAFADWQNPTTAELNANASNDPDGLIWNLTCALNTDGTTFDLDDSERDESLTFCQSAGDSTALSYSATVVHQIEMSKAQWTDATSVASVDGFNTATLALSLLAWRGVDYFAIMSIGKSEDAPFAVGDRIKMAEVSTDWIVPEFGSGENVRLTQTYAKRTDLNWGYTLAS